ncbi:MAG: PEP/pyruvate-binding domain-containing protein [Anaerolineae bacterium]
MSKTGQTGPLRSITPAIDIYIRLARYPILCDTIRLRMREELFRRGIVNPAVFEQEVRDLAIRSQIHEGLGDSVSQEEEHIWQKRKSRIRDLHTDAYFASNLGSALLDQIINEVLQKQIEDPAQTQLTFNPEISPWELLFRQGIIYEEMPEPEREPIQHHLEEIKVVLIRRIITDQLPFIGLARTTLAVSDLQRIYRRLIGTGKIGGKAAGMILAWKILQQQDPEFGPDISDTVDMPDSYFIGSEVIYEFILINSLEDHVNQKYRPLAEMQAAYPQIVQGFVNGEFTENIVEQLRDYLRRVKQHPVIVRSSSLLEDNFSYPFSGRYDSYFCANQGDSQTNLVDLMDGVRRVFASIFNPEAMMDRRKHKLLDYDERMAVILQKVVGEVHGRYFFPIISGIAYSQNFARWAPELRRQDGLLQLVMGLGTRVRKVNDHKGSRLIPLSHPQFRPEKTIEAIRQNAQTYVDLIDLDQNKPVAVPVEQILNREFPLLPLVASLDLGDYLVTMEPNDPLPAEARFILSFDYLTRDHKFIKLIRTTLMRLEKRYQAPVEIEFSLAITPGIPTPDYEITVLQCRRLRQGT